MMKENLDFRLQHFNLFCIKVSFCRATVSIENPSIKSFTCKINHYEITDKISAVEYPNSQKDELYLQKSSIAHITSTIIGYFLECRRGIGLFGGNIRKSKESEYRTYEPKIEA